MGHRVRVGVGASVAALLVLVGASPASALSTSYLPYGEESVGGAFSTMAFAPDGSLYAVDNGANRLTKYVTDAGGYVAAGSATIGADPFGIAVSPGGDLLVSDRGEGEVSVIRESGGVFTSIGVVPAGTMPLGIATAGDGTLFVADYGSDAIRVFEFSAGGYTPTQVIPVAAGPRFVAVSPDGTVAVSHQSTTAVTLLEPSAGEYVLSSTVTVGPALYGVGFRSDGALLVVSTGASATLYVAERDGSGFSVVDSRALRSGSYSVAVNPDGRVVTGTLNGWLTSYRTALEATSSVPSLSVGTGVSAALDVNGGSGTYLWSVTGGSLPIGVTLSAQGVLVGTPATAGAWSATVSVVDAENPDNGTTLSLAGTVAPRAAGPVVAEDDEATPVLASDGQPEALAATGSDASMTVLVAVVLLLLGAVVMARRPRKRTVPQA